MITIECNYLAPIPAADGQPLPIDARGALGEQALGWPGLPEDCIYQVHVPLHVTGIWLPLWRPARRETGSLGAGLLLEPGAEAEIHTCSSVGCGAEVHVEGHRLDGVPSVLEALWRLLGGPRARVVVRLPVPLAVGYAASAAVALAVAVGEAALRGMNVEEAAALAHEAEVAAGTGLGDVAAMFLGRGLELRLAPGAPGLARVASYPIPVSTIYSLELGRMTTSEMHRELGERLYTLAAPRLARLAQEPSLERFLEEARGFSTEAGFAPPWLVESLDKLVDMGLLLGWYAKKKVTVAVPRPGREDEARRELEKLAQEHSLMLRSHRPASAPLSIRPCRSSRSH
ncbi:pantoate kinase [Pyrodictium delaneyi]|uniref:pantoate kinase n=1 Tax=Pyrodictium delaneyi TaxID=1273541 RepID=UPI000AC5E251|nr:hypothetical protein [Pyrodictium delaneyi]